jgi:hypothetical protein
MLKVRFFFCHFDTFKGQSLSAKPTFWSDDPLLQAGRARVATEQLRELGGGEEGSGNCLGFFVSAKRYYSAVGLQIVNL